MEQWNLEHKDHLALLKPKFYGSDDEILQRIGVSISTSNLPKGYIRHYKEDFIVEEIHLDGKLSSIEPQGNLGALPETKNTKGNTLWLDLVKGGLSTLDAVNMIAQDNNLPLAHIGYAGYKDEEAITSQQLAIKSFPAALKEFQKHSHFFLKNAKWGQGILKRGELMGNRFSIIVRTEKEIKQRQILETLQELELNGFYNFYGEQRFSVPRLLSHVLGRLVLCQNYEGAVKTFLTEPSPWENDELAQVRSQAGQVYPDWPHLLEIFSAFAYPFRYELEVLKHLARKPTDFVGALVTIESQTQFWVYAYTSFLFNHALSGLILKKQRLPRALPLLTTPNWYKLEYYRKILQQHQITDLKKAVSPFRTVKLMDREVVTKAAVEYYGWKILPQGFVLSFSLPKACYATVLLRNFFQLHSGLPAPEWVKDGYIDAKAATQVGSVTEAKKILG